MAFGHQMGALRAPWLVKLKFGALRAPASSFCGGLVAFCHLGGGPFWPSYYGQTWLSTNEKFEVNNAVQNGYKGDVFLHVVLQMIFTSWSVPFYVMFVFLFSGLLFSIV